MKFASELTKEHPLVETLWASTREIFNIVEAARTNTDIITVPFSLINSYHKDFGKDLDEFSLETVKMFYEDAKKSGFSI